MIEEVRRQFRADPGIMAGTSDSRLRAVRRHRGPRALREMIAPGVLAVRADPGRCITLRWGGAAGMLMIGTIAGVLMANVLNNGGGAWDNAKKIIEAGG